ncbi:MAG: transcriptional regulator [Mycobacteriaceae bacterium]
MEQVPFEDEVAVVAALHHPLTRRAYEFVLERGWTTRDDASEALNVGRSVAAFHLDKLLDAGLLDARYERTSGRTGPGAGRTAKLYGRSTKEVEVSFPPRQYDLAGGLLADALARNPSGQVSVSEVARDAGIRMGQTAAEQRGRTELRTALMQILADNGYRPRERSNEIVLANCPFHSLAARHPELVCQMNLDLLTGVVDGLDCADTLTARLEPTDGECCVRLGPA